MVTARGLRLWAGRTIRGADTRGYGVATGGATATYFM
jgi:hypothetical protein